jgi:prolyl oligopeptidase
MNILPHSSHRAAAVSKILLWSCSIAFASFAAASDQRSYARKDPIRSTQFGVTYSDPYRWMENSDDKDLAPWVATQNDFTRKQVSAEFNELHQEFRKLTGAIPSLIKSSFDRKEQDDGMSRRNRFAPVDSLNLGSLVSPSKKYEIELNSETQSDLKTVRIKDTQSNLYLADTFLVKFSEFFWDESETSFVYVSDRDGRLGGTKPIVRRHVLGTRQQNDQVLYEASTHDTKLTLALANGQRFLVERSYLGKTTAVSKFDLTTGERSLISEDLGREPLELIDTWNGKLLFVDFNDDSAPQGAIVAWDPETKGFEVLVKQRDIAIDVVLIHQNRAYVAYVRDSASELYVYNLTSSLEGSDTGSGRGSEGTLISLPALGSIRLKGPAAEGGISFQFATYSSPVATYTVNDQNELNQVGTSDSLPFELVSERKFYQLSSGETAPIWILSKKGTALSPTTPVYLYGYGGFSVNILPWYSTQYLPFLKRGGVVAFVTLPGGLEYGQPWHRLGQLQNKRNVYDAFAESAKYLITNGWTSSDHLSIGGGSNGGLLAAATAELYPDLFAASVPEVGVLDMVRFARFTGGKWWAREYGVESNKKDFLNLLELSPYHMLKRNVVRPNILVVTADSDDRVVPAHSYKYAARLIEFSRNTDRDALLHTSKGSSHSWRSGQPEDIALDLAIKWDFILRHTVVPQ